MKDISTFRARSAVNKQGTWLLNILLIICILVLSNYVLEFSSRVLYQAVDFPFPQINITYYLLSIATLSIVLILFFLICNRIWLSCLITSSVCGILAVINYFVIKYHGAPLSFLLLRNFTTAMNVAAGYSFYIDGAVLRILLCTCFCVGASVIVAFCCPISAAPRKKTLFRDALLIIVSITIFVFGYMGNNPIKPPKTMTFRWDSSYFEYGFLPCTIETYFQMVDIVNEPEGYSSERLKEINIPPEQKQEYQTPDIILILNEALFDLRVLTDIPTDVPYFEAFDNMENCLRGYALSPRISGGTNNSEYELLTSNSLHLMPGITPFMELPLANANSIVSHLNTLGYCTSGLHGESPENYSRSVAYQGLGFDEIHFVYDFENLEYYHDRRWPSDESLYRNMIRWSQEKPEDMPRFEYLLTMQNHADYLCNDAKYDLVHVKKDYGDITEQINEYLTYIYLSGQAFQQLTEYYSNSDRPVIICMLGDHAPPFASDIVDQSLSDEENQLVLRKVPLMIWANFPLEEQDLGTMSMNYVVPVLLDIAGVPSSPYYRYMLQMHKQFPILSSYGVYYDFNGNVHKYGTYENAEVRDMINHYFYLEYNNLSDTRQQIFFDAD